MTTELTNRFKHISISQKQVQQFLVEKEQATTAAIEIISERVAEILEAAPASGKLCDKVVFLALDYSKRLKRPILEYQLSFQDIGKKIETQLLQAGYKTLIEDDNVLWFDWSLDDQPSEMKKHLAEIAKKKAVIS